MGVHVLTSHVAESEHSRNRARELGVSLLSNALALRNEMRAPESIVFQGLLASLREMSSLMNVLCASGFISPQNANAMIEAIDDAGAFLIAAQRSPLSERVIAEHIRVTDKHENHKGQTIKDNHDFARASSLSVTNQKEYIADSSSRSERVLNVVGTGSLMSIKDIRAHLPEYSEKMIQRELIALIANAKVKKIGLKRWSRYSCV